MTNVDTKDYVFDGIFGAAFQANAEGNVVPPLVNAIQQGLLDCPIFETYFHTEGQSSPSQTWSGVITFGGLDLVNCGVHNFVPLLQLEYYLFEVEAVAFG